MRPPGAFTGLGALLHLVALRRAALSPLRASLVVFGVALGVSALVATLAVNASILGAFRGLVVQLSGGADRVITGGEVGVPGELLEELAAVPGVAHVAGRLEIVTQSPKVRGPILVLGIDFFGDTHFLPTKPERDEDDPLLDPLSFANDPQAILLSPALAKAAGAEVGDPFPLLGPDGELGLVVRGLLRDEGLAAAFGGQAAVMSLEAADLAFDRKGRLDRIDVAAAPGTALEALDRALTEQLAGRGRLDTPDQRAGHLEAMFAPTKEGLALAGFIALLVGVFLIYNTVSVSVAERRSEIGVLRALGLSRGGVLALFLLEATALGALGALLGLPLGRALAELSLTQTAEGASRFYAPIRPDAPELTPAIIAAGLGLGLLATVLAALGPARAAARVEPIEAMRGTAARTTRAPAIGKLACIGLGLFLAGGALTRIEDPRAAYAALFLLVAGALAETPALLLLLRRLLLRPVEALLGVPGRLALDNAERTLAQSAVTAGALLTAVAASVCVLTWGRSLESAMFGWLSDALPADLYVAAGSPLGDQHGVPFGPRVLERLEGLPGVIGRSPARVVDLDVGARRVYLRAFDTDAHFAARARRGQGSGFSAGPARLEPGELAAERRVVLSENGAARLDKGLGDVLELTTPSGPRRYQVYALVPDYASDLGFVLMDRRWFLEDFGDDKIDLVALYLAEGADLEATAREARARLGGGDLLFVLSAAELRREIEQALAQFLAVFRAVEVIALVVALLGVLGTMLAVVLDRVREIGVLRALGGTRGQVAALFGAEAAFLGLAAALGGALAGVPMGLVFVRVLGALSTGWRVPYVFPGSDALRVGLAVVALAALAGWLVGRRAARLELPRALGWE